MVCPPVLAPPVHHVHEHDLTPHSSAIAEAWLLRSSNPPALVARASTTVKPYAPCIFMAAPAASGGPPPTARSQFNFVAGGGHSPARWSLPTDSPLVAALKFSDWQPNAASTRADAPRHELDGGACFLMQRLLARLISQPWTGSRSLNTRWGSCKAPAWHIF